MSFPKMRELLVVSFILFVNYVSGLDNGLALTPPMGFLTWQRFRCITDCAKYPNECISDRLLRRVADIMVEDGYKAAGYEYIIIDDCWLEKSRTSDGKLQEDRIRFPYGMKSLIKYIHSKGLKFGIYEDYGDLTCAGYPGTYRHEQVDAQLFADWEVDYLKVDGCFFTGPDYEKGFQLLKKALNDTGRPIVYSCEYPLYTKNIGVPTNIKTVAETCNLWRYNDDINDSWESLKSILDYYALKQDYIAQFAGPGHWHDPDMLLIGNYGLSYDQSKVQMALWAIMAAPLLMSAELSKIKPEYADILKNKKIIAVNQDPLGIQGIRVFLESGIQWPGNIEVWTRKVTPVVGNHHSQAIAFYSTRNDGAPSEFSVKLERIGLTYKKGYTIEDLYGEKTYSQIYYPQSNITVRVNPTGVVFLKATTVMTWS